MTNLFDSCQNIKPTEGDEVYMATGHVDGNEGICWKGAWKHGTVSPGFLIHECWWDYILLICSGNTSSNKPSQQDGAIIWPVGRHCRSPHQRRKKEGGFSMGCSGCEDVILLLNDFVIFWDVWVFSSDLTLSYKVPWCHNGTSWGPGVSWTRVHHHLDWSLHVELLVDGWPSSSWKLFIGETHENYPRFSMGFSRGECPTKATKIGPYTFSKRKDNKMIWQLSRLAQFLFPISSWKFRVFQKILMLSTNQITTHPSCFNF